MNKKYFCFLAAGILLLSISSCAPSDITFEEYGFWHGIWHGFSSFFAIIGRWFGMSIGFFAQNNTGFLYWLGYVIGVIFLMAMSSSVFPPMGLIILILLALAGFGVV
ncbi:MAG: hypothetical protein IPH12_14530 [Saprospirales bacterium]|nr:hypothetical protein [Saprospirales bacterium]MBK8924009.1 hypothetical protein [Saprospirales bacterium]